MKTSCIPAACAALLSWCTGVKSREATAPATIRLGTPNLPGDTMTLTGSVTSKEGDVVEVEVAGKNAWGNHVTGTVRVALPQ